MRKCVFEKIMPPPPLQRTWIVPGGPYYLGQWIRDTMFVVDLSSLLPGQKQVIRDIFQNYWDFLDRWNKKKPAYAPDMVTVAIKTAPQEVRQFSQIPILADSVSGKPPGVPDYCMSSTPVTMMLDGLARKHTLKLLRKKPTDKKQ